MKKCPRCGAPVERRVMSTAKYCSGKCRLAHNNAKRPKMGVKRKDPSRGEPK